MGYISSPIDYTMAGVTKEPSGFVDPSLIIASYDHTTQRYSMYSTSGVIQIIQNRTLYTFAATVGSPLTYPTIPAHNTGTGSYRYYLKFSNGAFTWTEVISGGAVPWLFSDVQVAIVTWNSSATIKGWLIKENHGLMQWQSHRHFHFNLGTTLFSGGTLTSGSYATGSGSTTDANISYGIDATVIADEDISHSLNAWSDGGPYTLMYRTGASGEWIWTATPTVPIFRTGGAGTAIYKNSVATGTWGLTVSAGSSERINYYVCAVPNGTTGTFRFVIIPGQTFYPTLATALAETFNTLLLGNLATDIDEIYPMVQVTYARGSGANVAPYIEQVTNIRGTKSNILTGGALTGTHSALSGRSELGQHPFAAIFGTGTGTTASALAVGAVDDGAGGTKLQETTVTLPALTGTAMLLGTTAQTVTARHVFSAGMEFSNTAAVAASITWQTGGTFSLGLTTTITEAGVATFATNVTTPLVQSAASSLTLTANATSVLLKVGAVTVATATTTAFTVPEGVAAGSGSTSDVSISITAAGTTKKASLDLQTGDGTTSANYNYIRLSSNATSPLSYWVGMYGDTAFSVRYGASLTTPSLIPLSISTTGACSFGGSTVGANLVHTFYSSGEGRIRLALTSGTLYNWEITTNFYTNAAFEIVPSTAVGGTTFSVPVFKVLNTGECTLGSATTTTGTHVLNTYTSALSAQVKNSGATSGTAVSLLQLWNIGSGENARLNIGNDVTANTIYFELDYSSSAPTFGIRYTGGAYFIKTTTSGTLALLKNDGTHTLGLAAGANKYSGFTMADNYFRMVIGGGSAVSSTNGAVLQLIGASNTDLGANTGGSARIAIGTGSAAKFDILNNADASLFSVTTAGVTVLGISTGSLITLSGAVKLSKEVNVADNVDVALAGVVASNGDQTINGFANGVAGQYILFFNPGPGSKTTFTHNNAGGTQKFLNPGGASLVVNSAETGYGGVLFYCNGTYWFPLVPN